MLKLILEWLVEMEFGVGTAEVLSRILLFIPIIFLCAISHFITRRFILRGITHLIVKTKTKWDDTLLNRKVISRLSHIGPAIVFLMLAPLALEGQPQLISILVAAIQLYMIVVIVSVIDSLLSAATDIYDTFAVSDQIPIKGFVQVARIILVFVGILVFLSVILNKTPLILLSGVGAFTAVLIIVFRDAILGFVAGIQLTTNRMIARGDWIEMPKYNADGDVIDISLTTVKIQNWDKTITTIPTYALISESFKNWRGMSEANGRRIKRSVFLDMGSIKFCTKEMLERFSKIEFITEYLEQKESELLIYNKEKGLDLGSLANGRRLTNIGTFRAYILAYLKQHPKIHQDMTLLVRQLAPTESGVPLEIYVFCNDIEWSNYEDIQSDIFDQILAVAPEFGLCVFQNPSGNDVRMLLSRTNLEGSSEQTKQPSPIQ